VNYISWVIDRSKLWLFENISSNVIIRSYSIFGKSRLWSLLVLVVQICNTRSNQVCVWCFHDTHQCPAPNSLKALSYGYSKGLFLGSSPPCTVATVQGESIQTRAALTNRNSMISKSQKLGFGVCHGEVKRMLGFGARCLVGRLARAMTKNVFSY
jgi:hypothetical protein